MDTKVNYTIVGAFVILLFAAIVLAIIWLSSGFSFKNFTTYQISMTESVNGLNVDAPVEYNGVDVGSVKSVTLNQRDPRLVEVLLNINSTTPITRGTTATLTTKGITGMTYIALKDASTDLTPLVALPGQPYPVIKTAPSIFLRLDTALSRLGKNMRIISETVQSVLNPENQQSIKATLHNLDRITQSLAENSSKLDRIIMNTARSSQQFVPLMQSSTRAMRMLEMQTLPAVYQLLSNLEQVTHNLSELTTQVDQNPAVLIRGVRPDLSSPGGRR